jgi:chemotaxis protein CheD
MTPRLHVDVFLAPGALTVHGQPTFVKTILGSCVAVCLWDAEAGVGGVNHFLLAHPGQADEATDRYGSVATPRLIASVLRAGGKTGRLAAAVIGGGHPIDVIDFAPIGDNNTAVALTVLREAGVPVVRQETGGAHGRKLLFNTATGELYVRRLRGQAEIAEEGGYA